MYPSNLLKRPYLSRYVALVRSLSYLIQKKSFKCPSTHRRAPRPRLWARTHCSVHALVRVLGVLLAQKGSRKALRCCAQFPQRGPRGDSRGQSWETPVDSMLGQSSPIRHTPARAPRTQLQLTRIGFLHVNYMYMQYMLYMYLSCGVRSSNMQVRSQNSTQTHKTTFRPRRQVGFSPPCSGLKF